jgi:predicted dehydrogenase
MMRCAVAGLGIGLAHVAGYIKSPDARLVAVADSWEPRRSLVGGTFLQGSMKVLEPLFDERTKASRWSDLGVEVHEDISSLAARKDIDLVSICTPAYLHEKHALMMLESGKHIILEKPVALSLEAAGNISELAHKKGLSVAVAYEFRENPSIIALKSLIDAGEFGEIDAWSLYHTRTPFCRDKWNSWIQKREYCGGLLTEETSHWFDLLCHLSGDDISSVFCLGSASVHPDFDYEDIAFCQGTMKKGAVWQLSHALTSYDFSFAIEVHGTRRMGRLALKEGSYSSFDAGSSKHWGILSHGPVNGKPEDARIVQWSSEAGEPQNIRDNVARVVDCLSKKRQLPVRIEDAVRALSISLAARRSMEQRRLISLEPGEL